MALGPTTSGPRLTAKVPERIGQWAPWHTCISDAWGVKPKAGPAGRIVDSRCMRDREDRRRGTRRIGAAAAIERPDGAERTARGSDERSARRAPQERPHECRGEVRVGECAGIGAAADALMRRHGAAARDAERPRAPAVAMAVVRRSAGDASEASREVTSAARSARENDGAAATPSARKKRAAPPG